MSDDIRPYRCGAFGTETGAQCVLVADHDCPHALEGTEAALLVQWAKRKRGRFTVYADNRTLVSERGAPE